MADYYVDTDVSGGAGDGSSWANAYATLQACLNALGTLSAPAVVHCRGVAADGATSAASVVTSATNTLTIQVDAADRHDGKWNTSKYRIERTGNGTGLTLGSSAKHVKVIGLQIKAVSSSTYDWIAGIKSETDGASFEISHCLLWLAQNHNPADSVSGIYCQYASNLRVHNCVIAHVGTTTPPAGSFGIYNNYYNNYIYNNTVSGFLYNYIFSNASITKVINCISHASTNTGFSVSGTTTGSGYNLSDRADAPGDNVVNSTDLDFVDPTTTTFDFHLAAGDTEAVGAGTAVSDDDVTNEAIDIDGATRTGAWAIGADQPAAAPAPAAAMSVNLGEPIIGQSVILG